MGKQVEMLEHHSDVSPHLLDRLHVIVDFHAVNDDPPFLVLLQPIDATNKGRFSRPRRPADDDAFTRKDFEIDVAQHMEAAEPLVDADELNRCPRHHRLPDSASRRSVNKA